MVRVEICPAYGVQEGMEQKLQQDFDAYALLEIAHLCLQTWYP
jgi:hypothetical protein